MTFAETVTEARNKKRLSLLDLSKIVGMSANKLSMIENNAFKRGPDPQDVVLLADILDCKDILIKYLEENPVYQSVIPKVFKDLNNIKEDPAIIFTKLAEEAEEASKSAAILARIFSNVDPYRVPNFEELFKKHFQHMIDIKRGVEIAEIKVVLRFLQEPRLRKWYAEQQEKCEEHGHHISNKTANGD